ncbi:MAG: GNAT family N-acetyltransferase [Deltaproteobacteria bacterium]|jgi:N-acetylglutamate synthase-like GNAT family acetyltransferase|nr:GNAT family N-acetyltransferase [Deltaproteobacteria bacterium]
MTTDTVISTDKSKLDVTLIHDFLRRSYWAEDIPLAIVQRSIENSLCFGVYEGASQVGFARVITDYATFGYVADVFIIPAKQKQGLGKKLMAYIMDFPELKGLRRWHLLTLDAQNLYKKVGFRTPTNPEHHMEKRNPGIYKNQ